MLRTSYRFSADIMIYTYIHIHDDRYSSIIFTSLEKDEVGKMLINSLLTIIASTITSQQCIRQLLWSRIWLQGRKMLSSSPAITPYSSEVGCYPCWCCGQQVHGFAYPASNIYILWLCFLHPFMILQSQ